MTEKLFISISGLIGVGKSTLCNRLSKQLDIPAYHESAQDQELMDKFYKNIKKYAYVLQYRLLNERYKQQQKIIWTDEGAIQDRSIYEDGVFVRMLYKDGILDKYQYDTYNETFKLMSRNMTHPTCIIHLDVSPEEALRRIKERGRPMEQNIDLSYLQKLKEAYDEFILEISKTIPVIHIDWSKFEEDTDFISKVILDEIKKITQIHKPNLTDYKLSYSS